MRRPSYIVVRGVLLLTVAIAVFGIGGVFKEVIVVSALGSLLAFTLAVYRRRRVTIDTFGIFLLGVTFATGLQVIPLPFPLLEWLSPLTAEALRRGASAQGLAVPTSGALSLDPESTRLAIIWWLAVSGVYLTTRQLQTRRDEQTPVLSAIPVFGLLILLSGLIHALAGLDAIYGVYEPNNIQATIASGALFHSVFLNPNHLAAFLNVGIAISLAWAGATHSSGRERVFWYISSVLLALGVLLTSSRAGILTGILVSMLIFIAGRSRYRFATAGALFIALLVLALVLPTGEQLMTLAGIDQWASTTHHEAHMLGLEVTNRWPIAGVGRGAFGVSHTFLGPDLHHYLTHAHNTPLQFIIDYGWPLGGAILLMAAALLLRPFLQSLKAPLGLGVSAGFIALIAQNLVDFSFDILGIAVIGAILAASLRNSVRGFRANWILSTVFSVSAICLVLWLNATTSYEAGPRREATVLEAPTDALQLYPADAYAFLGAGLKTRNAALLDHAAWLHPSEPRIHIARAAMSDGEAQKQSIRSALSSVRSYKHITSIFELIRRTSTSSAQVIATLPTAELTAKYLNWLSPMNDGVLQAALSAYPESNSILAIAGRRYLASGRLSKADDVATRLVLLEDPVGYKLMGTIFLRKDKPLRAYHMFIAAEDAPSRIRAAEIALKAGLPKRALVAIDKVRAEPKYLKQIQLLRGEARSALQSQTARQVNAIDVFEQAAESGPSPTP